MTEMHDDEFRKKRSLFFSRKNLRKDPGDEFPEGARELEVSGNGVDRRQFLGMVGASMALAGLSTACVRKPKEHIVEYSKRPEEILPGKPIYFASALSVAGAPLGVLVQSNEGRPTKIEGNPGHPSSLGSTGVWGQAVALEIYDQDRAKTALQAGATLEFDKAQEIFLKFAESLRTDGGEGYAVALERQNSPTVASLLAELKKAAPKVQVYEFDGAYTSHQDEALKAIFGAATAPVYAFNKLSVVASFDSDFMGTDPDHVRNSRLFAEARRVTDEKKDMNRLYAVEAAYSLTGSNADHRLSLTSSRVGDALIVVAKALNVGNGFDKWDAKSLSEAQVKWLQTLAKDLQANKGKAAVVVGLRQPAWVHALGLAINEALGVLGTSVQHFEGIKTPADGSSQEFAEALAAGKFQHALVFGFNPVYSLPADAKVAEGLAKLKTFLYSAFHADETAVNAQVFIPQSHELESWGDAQTSDGALSIRQPLIEPLFPSLSLVEALQGLITGEITSAVDSLQAHWKAQLGADVSGTWRQWLHEGIAKVNAPVALKPRWDAAASLKRESAEDSATGFEVNFYLDRSVFDGRYGNNPWLQELPDTISKITWDNALYLNPKMAAALGVEQEDVVSLEVGGKTMDVAVAIVRGVADNSVALSLGYGRNFGSIAKGAGFNANIIRTMKSPWFALGGKLSKQGRTYKLARTQEHSDQGESVNSKRPIVRENTVEGWKKDPNFVWKEELMGSGKLSKEELQKEADTLLWTPPNKTEGMQLGMVIDLNTCTGCNACTIACQSENNISTVGKERVLQSREMHWIRIDRYFTGTDDNPEVVVQPVACMHCETAPCEGVCPVGATTHSPEGTNDMAYNRCIGTRYCANNCPYKVRRFNYFNFSKENDELNPLYAMQKNPNVTVRFRGVIEKCTYCVQRVSYARREAKKAGFDRIPDGAVVTACQQVCPTQAIVFGDINDKESRVSRFKEQSRDYALLTELATRPRTSYLAKLRNKNPELS